MKFIVVIKDEQNELSFICNNINDALNFVNQIMKRSNYDIEIITKTEV